jgi:hypothetical protein
MRARLIVVARKVEEGEREIKGEREKEQRRSRTVHKCSETARPTTRQSNQNRARKWTVVRSHGGNSIFNTYLKHENHVKIDSLSIAVSKILCNI